MPDKEQVNSPAETAGAESPDHWDDGLMQEKWLERMRGLVADGKVTIPLKRIVYQVEQAPEYWSILNDWKSMNGSGRRDAWDRLLNFSEQSAKEVLPTCVQCGECCRKSSPTLHTEDLSLIRNNKLPWDRLVTLRVGEPVRNPFEDKLFTLQEERIKVKEKPNGGGCVFHDDVTDLCRIYEDRPIQCRAQACWDPSPARQLTEQPYLTRKELFSELEFLVELLDEHDRRCRFEELQAAFDQLRSSNGDNIEQVIDMIAFEDHFRNFICEQFEVPGNTIDLFFGRGFVELIHVFGFRVKENADGTRMLLPDK